MSSPCLETQPSTQSYGRAFDIIVRSVTFCLIVAWTGVAVAENSTTAALRSEWNLVDHLSLDGLILQSHRGAGELGPDNTIEGFKLGWSYKTVPEADIRTTTDGVIVVFHDATLKRVVKNCPPALQDKGIDQLTWAQVQELRVGTGQVKEFPDEPVPRLADVFTLMQGKPERHIYLDIKQVDLAKLAALVNEYGVSSQVTLATPKHEIIREWKGLVPQSDTLLWTRGTEAELTQTFEKLREDNFEGITQLQIHIHLKGPAESISSDSVDPFKLSDAFLIKAGNELRTRNILFQTFPYGGTTPQIYAKLLDLGVMSFATDRPDVTREALRAYYETTR